ncbi:MAG: pyridoxamine 5'-phosphate oxidase family protein [Bacteroidota bacterium]
MLTPDIKKYLDQSVLCWLATVSKDGIPNVSPKEIFTYLDDQHIGIAHIASPKSIKNIKANPNVCVSFVDILVQKGYKLVGQAEIIDKRASEFSVQAEELLHMAGSAFPVQAMIKIKVTKVAPILAPSYVMYPDTTTEERQVASALKAYKMKNKKEVRSQTEN